MHHLWIAQQNEWTPHALSGDVFQLPGATPTPTGAVLRRAAAATAATADFGWVLLAPPTVPVRVNGKPVPLGIRALCHRDEIRLPGAAPMFLSTEQLVAIEPFTGAVEAKCPRCTKTIEHNSPAVRCGSCNTSYHQGGARRCFTYGENPICIVCGADAVVSNELSWWPEEL